MKANELMRFDWVCLEDDNTPRQVDWIRSGEVGLFWNQIVTPPYLKPIPLTAEILEKNGFDMDDYTVHFKEDEHYMLELVFEDDELKWTINCNEYTIMNFEYVHELQHALRLCGIEKEIEL